MFAVERFKREETGAKLQGGAAELGVLRVRATVLEGRYPAKFSNYSGRR